MLELGADECAATKSGVRREETDRKSGSNFVVDVLQQLLLLLMVVVAGR